MNSQFLPIEHLIDKTDRITRVSLQCCYPGCSNKSIQSHTLAENYLKYLHSDLTQIVTQERRYTYVLKRQRGGQANLFVPINKNEFSTFPGFCIDCDTRIFVLIDEFNGEMTPEKATLIHYRNICYGIHHILLSEAKLSLSSESNCIDLELDEVKNVGDAFGHKYYYERSAICLQEHQKRKEILEKMIQTQNFKGIRYLKLVSNSKPAFLCCGRSNVLLDTHDEFLQQKGYPFMPWVTYMTLPYAGISCLAFCWLNQDEEHAIELKEILQSEGYKIFLEKLSYMMSDSLAVEKSFFQTHQQVIESLNLDDIDQSLNAVTNG